jgi:GTP cyclohydrolase IA
MSKNMSKNQPSTNPYDLLIRHIGENPEREGLVETPARALKAFEFLTQGYGQTLTEVIGDAIFTTPAQDMVIVKNIEVYSLCEHHLLPFMGKCHVAYIPQGKVLGLSKIARIVDMFARRLQIQETLTHEIAKAIESAIQPEGIAVTIEAEHLCMRMRGVEKQNSVMLTSCLLGSFREDASTRAEYLALIK